MSRVHIEDPDERQLWIEGRRERLELAREAGFRRVSWLSVAGGVATALGAFAVCVGIAAAVLHAAGIDAGDLSDDDWTRFGFLAGVLSAAALLAAYSLGGYVAGRMARRAGLRHGALVFVVGAVVVAAAVGVTVLEGGATAISDRLESLGAPTDDSAWFGVGVLSVAVALAGMLLGSLLGGVRGERWHQRLLARALDPNIGPEADLRAHLEAQRAEAAKALERAREAGVVPAGDDGEPEPAAPRREPEPTVAGPPKRPSSLSSGP
jgi:4-amino-4-deoxy-L-arabinose transferase-like glycosyltransferase